MLYNAVHMLMENLYTDFHCLKRSESNPMALPKIGANWIMRLRDAVTSYLIATSWPYDHIAHVSNVYRYLLVLERLESLFWS